MLPIDISPEKKKEMIISIWREIHNPKPIFKIDPIRQQCLVSQILIIKEVELQRAIGDSCTYCPIHYTKNCSTYINSTSPNILTILGKELIHLIPNLILEEINDQI